jgi:hypothetical protein
LYQRREDQKPMKTPLLSATLALGLAVLAHSLPVHAQVATSLEQAELAGLKPEIRAEVQKRLGGGGQTVSEILTTMLLNNIKLKHPASRIVAMDFARGAAAVENSGGGMEVVNFDTTTLQIKS